MAMLDFFLRTRSLTRESLNTEIYIFAGFDHDSIAVI